MKHSNKRILIWTASYPPVLGGLQTVTHQLAHGLAERGHHVMVLTNRHPYSLASHEQQGLVSVERIKHYRPIKSIHSLVDMGRYLRSRIRFPVSQRLIVSLINNFQPDIINIHFPDSQLPYWPFIQKKFNGRLVVSLHGHDILRWFTAQEDGIINPLLDSVEDSKIQHRIALSSILKETDMITACSAWMLTMMQQLCADLNTPTQTIHNAVQLDRFKTEIAIVPTQPYLFSFGRLAPHKGFDLLIQAFSQIKNQIPHLQLLIGGEGEAQEHLAQIAQTCGVSNEIHFCGRLSPEEVVAYAKGSQAIIIPSKREPFGISVLESIASGKPVVATNVGGIPEAAGALATLVPPTVEGIAQGIRVVLQQEQIPLAHPMAIEAHLAQFTLQRFIDQYETALVGND